MGREVDHQVAALAYLHALAQRVGHVLPDAALPAQVAAQAQALQRTLEAAHGRELDQAARVRCVEGGAAGAARRVVRVAGAQAPAQGRLAAEFQVDAAHLRALDAAIGLLVRGAVDEFARVLRQIVLAGLEQRGRTLQPVLQPGALETQLEGLAGDGVQDAALLVAVVLGCEDFRVAQVGRVPGIDVPQQAGVGRDFVAVAVVAQAAEIVLARGPAAQAGAGHGRPAIGQRETPHGIAAALAHAAVVAAVGDVGPARLGQAAVAPVEEVVRGGRRAQRCVAADVDVVAHMVPAHGNLVLAPEQRDRAAGREVQAVARAVAPVFDEGVGHAQAGAGVRRAAPVDVAHVVVAVVAAVGGAQQPAVVQPVRQVQRGRGVLRAEMRPARVVGHRAVEGRAAAVRMEQRKAGAHAGTGVLLVFEAGDEPGGGRQGRADHGVQALPALAEVADVAVAVRLHGHDAAMHAAFAVQRQGQIGLGAAQVPAAQRQRCMAPRRLARLLAHEVHRAARVARALEQARGAAHDFHAVVEGGVHVGGAEVPQAVDGRGQPVELEVADAEAARGKLVAVAVAAAHRQAGRGGLQRLRDRELACIVHELARDHADRLRCLARRQLQARGRSRGTAGIAGRAFGGARIGGGAHGDGAQFGVAFPGSGPVLVGGPDC
ncbi:MAG: hypothetical protein GAK34_01365 [Delftia tsuruhatensis]|nr:MAG: hypothetical protein GAK34_01365 [Delftia tsuruhatensis]